jgi:hypothetical protein
MAGLILHRWGRGPRSFATASTLALGPASILLANALDGGQPLAPLRHISEDHIRLAAEYGAAWGPIGWRLINVIFWPLAALVALTPGFGFLALRAAARRPTAEASGPLALALVPTAIYAMRGLVLGNFLPLLRMALVPASLLVTCATAPSRRALRWTVITGLVWSLAALALAQLAGPMQGLAGRASPLERLPSDLRAGVEMLRRAHGIAAMDQSAQWEDIVIAHHAQRDRFALYAPARPPECIIAIRGAALDRELRASGRAFAEACQLDRESGRISLWRCAEN